MKNQIQNLSKFARNTFQKSLPRGPEMLFRPPMKNYKQKSLKDGEKLSEESDDVLCPTRLDEHAHNPKSLYML